MILTNIYTRPEPIVTVPRVPFISLRFGQRYTHSVGGPVSQIFATGDKFITIKREDDWLVRCTPDMEIWNKMVIKL